MIGGNALWSQTNPVPLLWALCVVLMSLGLQGRTPGKRWMKLSVTGPGCLTCREIRRMGWALALGFEALLHGLVPAPVSTGLLTLGLALLGWQILWPALRAAPDFPHNRATGIHVAPSV